MQIFCENEYVWNLYETKIIACKSCGELSLKKYNAQHVDMVFPKLWEKIVKWKKNKFKPKY